MNGKLLDCPFDGGPKQLLLKLLIAFDGIFGEACDFLLGVGEIAQNLVGIFGLRLLTLALKRLAGGRTFG